MANDAPTAPYNYTKVTTKISDQQIAQVAYNAGFRGEALVTAVTIALGESHGNTTALNDHGEFSVGLWQVNVNGYLVARLRQYGLVSWQDLWDPQNNANAAYKISGGGRHWGAWSVYNHGIMTRKPELVNRAITAAKQVDPTMPPVVIGATQPNPNSEKITLFLTWWNNNLAKHDALTNWNDILSRFQADTNNPEAASYIRSLLVTNNIPLDVAIGLDGALPFLTFLGNQIGTDKPGDVGFDMWAGLNNIITEFTDPIKHAFYFLIFIIIALVLILVGFKYRSNSGAEA